MIDINLRTCDLQRSPRRKVNPTLTFIRKQLETINLTKSTEEASVKSQDAHQQTKLMHADTRFRRRAGQAGRDASKADRDLDLRLGQA